MIIIAGDIGGTKTILRLVQVTSANQYTTLDQKTYRSGSYPDLVPIVEEFITHTNRKAEAACFAIAGPVVKDTSKLTNLNWLLQTSRLESELNLKKVSLINDFAAVSYGIPALSGEDLHSLQTATLDSDSPIAIIGAGTGLGESFLIPSGSSYQIFPTEGGHTDFAPQSDLETQLLQYIRQQKNIDHVSVERVVSGQGIITIYQFLRDTGYAPQSPEIAQKISEWEQQINSNSEITIDPAAIVSSGAAQQDRLCLKAMSIFVEAYGAEAGNLALKLLPYGGLYIAGGIAAKNLDLMQSKFMSAFKHKGRVSHLLDRVPVNIVLNPEVGLLGSIVYALNS